MASAFNSISAETISLRDKMQKCRTKGQKKFRLMLLKQIMNPCTLGVEKGLNETHIF